MPVETVCRRVIGAKPRLRSAIIERAVSPWHRLCYSPEDDYMVFHSKATLEHWVAEFIDARSAGEEIRVAVQDGSGGEEDRKSVV